MIRSITLALGDLGNRRILSILGQALVISLALFVGLGIVMGWLLAGADPCDLVSGSCPLDAGTGGISAVLLTLLGIWLLFPGVAIGVITGFGDRIAAAVEERHYPESAAKARPLGVGRAALMGLRSGLRILLFNLLALPFYLLLLVTGVGPLVLFVIVNGLAFGRDLGELAAARHGDRVSRKAWLGQTRGQQHAIGIAVSAMFLVPFVNLLAPIVGAAAAVHLYNRRGGPL